MSGKQCRHTLKRLCCPCCMYSGMRAYLRMLEEGRCAVTHQALQNVEDFDAFTCVKFLYILQRDRTSDVWIPTICSRLLAIYYDDPVDVEAYLPQICRLLLAFERPCIPLEVAVLHLCSCSLHFSMHIWWFLIGEIEDWDGRRGGEVMYSRAANLLLCVYAAVQERAMRKGMPGLMSQNDYLERLLQSETGNLRDITQAIQNTYSTQTQNPENAQRGDTPCRGTSEAARREREESNSTNNNGGNRGAEEGISGLSVSSHNSTPTEISAIRMPRSAGGGSSAAGGAGAAEGGGMDAAKRRGGRLVNAPSQGAPGVAAGVSQAGEDAAMQGKEKLLRWLRAQCMEGNGFFQEEAAFVVRLTDIAELLRNEAPHNRQEVLNHMVKDLNELLSHKKLCHFGLPFCNSSSTFRRVVRISPEYAKVFSTAQRCPYMITVESIATIRKCSAPDLDPVQRLKRFSKEMEFKTQVVRDGLMPKLSMSIPKSIHVASSVLAPLLDSETTPERQAASSRREKLAHAASHSWNESISAGTDWLHTQLPSTSPQQPSPQPRTSPQARSPASVLSPNSIPIVQRRKYLQQKEQARQQGVGKGVEYTGEQRTSPGEQAQGLQSLSPDTQKGDPLRDEDPASVGFVTMGACSMHQDDEQELLSALEPPSEDIARTLQTGSRIGVSAVDATAHASGMMTSERWENQRARIKMASPYGRMRGWDVETVIVKSFDDVRQEALAMQLFEQIVAIWKQKRVLVKVFPYKIIPTSSTAGLVQGITGALSLDWMKKQPSFVSLLHYFQRSFGSPATDSFRRAQMNFVRSLAGYSILCYVLQIKDRHNGNLLLDHEGHMIHIDFAFILGMSPGNLNFERAPFKLTDEYLELMGGKGSAVYGKFQQLCVQAFMEVRANHHKVAALVEIMMARSSLPCFKGPRATRSLDAFMSRMELGLSTQGCEARVLELIEASVGSWATRQYDHYQKVVNGIET